MLADTTTRQILLKYDPCGAAAERRLGSSIKSSSLEGAQRTARTCKGAQWARGTRRCRAIHIIQLATQL